MATNDGDYNRPKFELWISDGGIYPKAIERDGEGYRLMQTQLQWIGWKKAIESDELDLITQM